MMASLFAGVSGLKNHQTRMNVTGDNIANINTIGYKLGRSTFQEALVQTLRGAARPTSTTGGTNPLQMGLGMSLATIDNQFSQGGLESTGQVTDIAIQGSGFFMLSDGDATYYTRAGAFGFDANANMIQNSTGYILQGKMAETNGEILASTPLGNISIPFGQMDPPNPTTEIVMSSNLNSSATDADATLTSAGTTNISSVSGTAINGVGGTHNIIISGSNATNSVGSGTHANQINDVTGTAAAAVLGAGNYGQPIPADYDYVVTAVNALGETLGAEVTLTVPATADSVDVTWNAVAGATSYKIYRRANGEEYNEGSNGLIGTWTAGPLSFSDTGLAGTPASPPSANMTVNLVGTETLGSNLDVTGTDGLRMRVDNGDWISLAEITTASTINDLISVINSKANGITASIVNGQVQIQRDYAGAGSSYNFEIEDNGTGDVVQQVFGTNDLVVNSGTASTLQTLDTFTPTGRTALDPVVLALITDTNTGLVTGIDDIGGGGISTVTGNGGLQAGTLVIDTDDTQHAASITVYDSQGGRHNVTITFTKSINENTWYWEAQLGGNEIIRGSNTGQVIFNDDGSLAAFTFDGSATTFTFDPNNGAEDMEIAFDGGTANTYDGLTGFSNESTASAVSQDGYTSGSLNAISVDTNGLIIGIFSNGVSRTLAHIYLADFNNPAGLLKVGSSLFQESVNSGIAVSGIAGETVSGTMTSGALEMSNVDLAQEFTSMIVSQRGYQANARIITTSDQMLAELVQLKR